jgi:hypothetical protein
VRISPNPPPSLRDLAALRAKSGTFSPADPAAAAQAAPAPAQPVTSVDMLVILAAEGEAERRRRMAAQAEQGLAALEGLQAEIEGGEPSAAKLQELAAWTQSVDRPDDPQLAQILEEIELRALVELAKHDRDADGQ